MNDSAKNKARDARLRRLSAAMRQNLKRRKAQARGRLASESGQGEGKPAGGDRAK